MDILAAIQARHSTRAFTPQAVSREQIETILATASHAPSGVNTQPWKVVVAEGKCKQAITETLLEARAEELEPRPDYAYYPGEWLEPYAGRRIECGRALYTALGIERHDKTRKLQAWQNNYHFFGAPVGLFFFIDRKLATGSWLDMGMFIQSVMLAAVGLGLATCAQAALADYPERVRKLLEVDENYALICGMSLGYADTEHPVNQYRLPREPVANFTTWCR